MKKSGRLEVSKLKHFYDSYPTLYKNCSVFFCLFVCLQSLERCQLKDVVSSKPEKLDSLGELLLFVLLKIDRLDSR